MSEPLADFPLDAAISAAVSQYLDELEAERECGLLDHVTPTTRDLLQYWFGRSYCEARDANFHEGQKKAIVHCIYAHEVLGARSLRQLYEQLAPTALNDSKVFDYVVLSGQHPKYAAKMATGTGKTWVLNALLVWQYLNSRANPEDDRFSANFLVVAPGLIVYDRLLDSFLGKESSNVRDFSTSDVYVNREVFLPHNYREQVFKFLRTSVMTKADLGRAGLTNGMVAVTNWHLLAGVEDPDFVDDEAVDDGVHVSPQEAVSSFFPISPGKAAGNALDVLDRRFERGRALQWLSELPNLVVFNDEAHHIHEVRKAGEATEVEWQKSLREIAEGKGHRFVQIDFSATPYNDVGSGAKRSRFYFPHIIADFDLHSAMSIGLVKSLAIDKRREVAALPLDFRAERDPSNEVVALSGGQRVMLSAGLKKLEILEEKFAEGTFNKHPKLMVICEDTTVTKFVISYLKERGLSEDEILAVDSNRRGDMTKQAWADTRERLFNVDTYSTPRVIVSVLMLREGFDVNNICVIVPLRSSQASILLEQTVGRGLRLMWRGDEQIDELKVETRERFKKGLEPTNLFDVLFVIEHPAFVDFYDSLIAQGLAVEVGNGTDRVNPTGDLEEIGLREDFEAFDFLIPIVVQEAEEELALPALQIARLPQSKYPLDLLKKSVGRGDQFVSEDAQTGTLYGDYRVDTGVMTATGYNDYLARMTNRISEALGSGISKSARTYNAASRYPMLFNFKPTLAQWIDVYIKGRLFGGPFSPLDDENWRILLIEEIAHTISGAFATALTEAAENEETQEPIVVYRALSEVGAITGRSSHSLEVHKCIYPKLPVPTKSGGLEKMFMQWASSDSSVAAFTKIHEYRHDFLRRPYLKDDGLPASYSPDFLVRTADCVYLVETKAQSSLSDENVRRKQQAAIAWCDQINRLAADDREGRVWHYVLLSERTAKDWRKKNSKLSDVLEFARLRRPDEVGQTALL